MNLQQLIARADRLAKKGDVDEAKNIYLNVLQKYPKNQKAKKSLAELSTFKNKNKNKNLSTEKLNSLMAFYSNGKPQLAIDEIQVLINDYPKEAILFNILGACYKLIKSDELAIESYKKAIEIKPNYAEVYFNLGIVYRELNELEESKECYQKAIEISPNYPAAQNNLGNVLKELGQIEQSIEHFEWAIAYKANFFEAYYNLSKAYVQINNYDKALECLKKVIQLNSKFHYAYFDLGVIYSELGLNKEAIKKYEHALDLKKDFAQAFLNLTLLKKIKINSPLIEKFSTLLKSENLQVSDKVSIYFALAKINEDHGNLTEFFKLLKEGNDLRKKELNYSVVNTRTLHELLEKLFKKEINTNYQILLKSKLAQKPIFIVGMPRSGTTLVEQIISSHQNVYGAGELDNMKKNIYPILNKYLEINNDKIYKADIESIRKNYLKDINNLNFSQDFFTDKMPLNFRFIGFILKALPEAKIIHLNRSPIATCWSNYRHNFSSGNGFSYDMDDLVKFYNLYVDLMEFWHQLFPGKIYDISYEDLTINQEEETRKLLEYCELDWDENCLNFHTNKRAVNTASAAQVRQKMYQGSSEAWKQYEPFIKTLIAGLGR